MVQIAVKSKNKLLFKFIISYFIMLSIFPFIFGFGTYYTASSEIRQGVNSEYQKTLILLQQNIDKKLQEIQNISYIVAWETNVQRFMSSSGRTDPEAIYMTKEIMKRFEQFKSVNSLVKDIAIYFTADDYLLGINGKSANRAYYDANVVEKKMSYEQWQSFITGTFKSEIVTLGHKSAYYDQDYAVFMQSIPLSRTGKPSANIMITLNMEELKSTLKNVQLLDESDIIIIDNKGKIIASANEQHLEKLDKYAKASNATVNTSVVDGNVIIYESSKYANWRYMAVIPENLFLHKLSQFNVITLILLLIYLIGGVIAAIWLAKRNYAPINDVVQKINDSTSISNDSVGDELGYIENMFSKMMSEKEKYRKELKQQSGIMREHLLVKLLKGMLKKDLPKEELCDSYGIKLVGNGVIVAVIETDDLDGTIFEKDNEEHKSIANFAVTNVTNELLSERFTTHFIEIDQYICCLICVEDVDKNTARGSVGQVLFRAKEFLEEHLNIYLAIALSDIHIDEGLAGISTSYYEALDALEYKLILGNDQVLSYNEIQSTVKPGYRQYITNDKRRNLIYLIKSKDFKNAQILLNGIFDEIINDKSLSVDLVKSIMVVFVDNMLSAIEELETDIDNGILGEINIYERMFHCKSVKELKDVVGNIINELEQKMTKDDEIENKIKIIKQYVQNKYDDMNLNVSQVANDLGFNCSYLSRYFKEQVGCGLLEYINTVRIEHALELLNDNRYSIKDVANLVGYFNSNTFIRTFKKIQGITPGQYKESIRV